MQKLLSRPEIKRILSSVFIECYESRFDVSKPIESLEQEGFMIEKVGDGSHFDIFAMPSLDVRC